MNTTNNYAALRSVLDAAYNQAAVGKGAERHGNAGDIPFTEQPMFAISQLLDTDGGLAFQAIKKIVEARGLPTPERQERELLGAINYIAGMVIRLREEAAIDFANQQYESLFDSKVGGCTTQSHAAQKAVYELHLAMPKDVPDSEMVKKIRDVMEARIREGVFHLHQTPPLAAMMVRIKEGAIPRPADDATGDQNLPESKQPAGYPPLEHIMMATGFAEQMVSKDELADIVVHPGDRWEIAEKHPGMYARRFVDMVHTQAMLNPGRTIHGVLVQSHDGYKIDLTDQRDLILEMLEGGGMYTVSTYSESLLNHQVKVVYNHNLKKE